MSIYWHKMKVNKWSYSTFDWWFINIPSKHIFLSHDMTAKIKHASENRAKCNKLSLNIQGLSSFDFQYLKLFIPKLCMQSEKIGLFFSYNLCSSSIPFEPLTGGPSGVCWRNLSDSFTDLPSSESQFSYIFFSWSIFFQVLLLETMQCIGSLTEPNMRRVGVLKLSLTFKDVMES